MHIRDNTLIIIYYELRAEQIEGFESMYDDTHQLRLFLHELFNLSISFRIIYKCCYIIYNLWTVHLNIKKKIDSNVYIVNFIVETPSPEYHFYLLKQKPH